MSNLFVYQVDLSVAPFSIWKQIYVIKIKIKIP